MQKSLPSTQAVVALAFTILPLIGASNTSATPHAKATLHGEVSRVRRSAPGTRLFATGTVDPATSSVKAISADSRFTWVRLTPLTVIVQGGKRITPGGIGEGDKLLCLGKWVDDAWGPVFQAKRVEVIGRISDAGLQAKVAAACQSVAQGNPAGSGGSGFSRADSGGAVDRQSQDLQDYMAALSDRYDAMDQAKQALVYQIGQSDGIDLHENKAGRLFYGDHTNYKKEFEQARQDYEAALERLGNISPVPPAMSKADGLVKESCAKFQGFSSLVHDDYDRISVRAENRYYVRDLLKKYGEGTDLFDQALAETKRVIGNYTR